MADITTTTEEEGERMSNTLHRAVADASCIIVKQEDQIQRALQVLQRAQRYDLQPHGDFYHGEGMVHSSSGDYVDISDVKAAIDILQEGQR